MAAPGAGTGTITHLQVTCSDLRGHPAVAGLVPTLQDVTEQRALHAELEYQALHDELPGCPGAPCSMTGPATRSPARDGLTVLMPPSCSSTWTTSRQSTTPSGIPQATTLVQAAGRLVGAVRASDTVARVGGDEFAIVIEDLSDPESAALSASRVVEAFRVPFTLAAGEVTVTASVGIATTARATTAEEVLRHADLAMYAAKRAAKSTWRAYAPGMSGPAAAAGAAATDALTRQSFPGPCQPRPQGSSVGDHPAGRPLAAHAAAGPARPARHPAGS